jgi:hypothetical protein
MSEHQPELGPDEQECGPGRWAVIIMLAIILAFVIIMVALGVSPDVAGGIGAAALAACSAATGGRPDAKI